MGVLERQFRELPSECRRLTGPLFWLHGDEPAERLAMVLGKVAEGGNGCFTAESRPHSDWLGEGWFRDLAVCLQAAKQNDLQMWIFDEKWWPSGEVAGKVPAEFGSKRLTATAVEVTGPARHVASDCGGPGFLAVLAGRLTDAGVDGSSLLDLTPTVRDGALAWEAPQGRWQVMAFTWKPEPFGGRYLVDGASRDAVEWYLRTVYQPHAERFGADFGACIQGFFYDEPETRGDWGTEVMPVLAERQVDWKKALVAWKFRLAGEEQAAARYQYADALAEAWGRTLYGGLSGWCREHGVRSIGHFLEHGNAYLDPELCAGNVFSLLKYSDMGGIDAVFDQFVWGKRVTRDVPVWQTPKLGSSITHAYGKPDDVTMVEIFGARGQDLTYPEMKWWLDHMQVSGVNFVIPHSFNPRAPRDTDCPPYFYHGGYEPRWPLYRVFADYSSRLSLMLSGGRHVCPVALLFAGTSGQAGKAVAPEAMSEALQDALYDCDWLPYEVLEADVRVTGRELALREERYRVLVVPPVETIPYGALARARDFLDAGGVVVGYGFLPTRSATLGRTAADIAALREAVWGLAAAPGLVACRTTPAGGRSYLLPEPPTPAQLQQVLGGDAGVHPTLEVLAGQTGNWLHVLHRVKAGRDVFFVTNQNHTGGPRQFRFRLTAPGAPELWDAMRNEVTPLPCARQGDQAELDLTLEPNESVLLVFQAVDRGLPARVPPGAVPVTTVAVVRDPTPPVEALPALDSDLAGRLAGCHWVWFPEDEPARSAPPGVRSFRRQVTLPADRRLVRAGFIGSADNSMEFFIDGQSAGRSDSSAEGWRNPVELDLTGLLHAGVNQLAVAATNATDKPSPAGVVGRLHLEFEPGPSIEVRIDSTWKAAAVQQAGWQTAGFDDAAWPAARELVPFGGGPWGRLGGGLTRSPAKADPFWGHADVPAGLDLAAVRVFLEMERVEPEAAAAVMVNGARAGGVIGRPLRLDITAHLKRGRNVVRIEPFAPGSVRLHAFAR